MAVLAQVGCRQVGQRVLAGRADAVVAAGTVIEDVVVIEVGRQPARSGVAIVAVLTALDVAGVFAGSR